MKKMIDEHWDMLTCTIYLRWTYLSSCCLQKLGSLPEFGVSMLVRWKFLSDLHNVVQPPCIWSCCSASCRRSWCIVMQLRVPTNTDFLPLLVLTFGPHFARPSPFPHSCLFHPAFDFQTLHWGFHATRHSFYPVDPWFHVAFYVFIRDFIKLIPFFNCRFLF